MDFLTLAKLPCYVKGDFKTEQASLAKRVSFKMELEEAQG